MSKQGSSGIDFGGARGSNAGDEFHELWALRYALGLLDFEGGLRALTVEGISAERDADRNWDGVDCGLFFGHEEPAQADLVLLKQFKYSAAAPAKAWTAARLAAGKRGDAGTSAIRRLATAHKDMLQLRSNSDPNTVRVLLVTNQPIAASLVAIIEQARCEVPNEYRKTWSSGGSDLHRLVHASGLTPQEFLTFARALDLHGTAGSRFAAEDAVLKSISVWTDDDLRATVDRFREYIRRRMLPEGTRELLTREKILLQFAGVSDDHAIFPCPSSVKRLQAAVSRQVAAEIAQRLIQGEQHLCLHGAGGVGKTTLLQQIEALLPVGSELVLFDCYGGGSYLDASALRHRPSDAFVQLSNELAIRLRLPLLLTSRAGQHHARAFRRRLRVAASSLATTSAEALVVIAVDAADNSVFAAASRTPVETSFVHELMSFDDLPRNVRILITARTGHLTDLAPPNHFARISLPAFTPDETAQHVALHWAAPPEWIDDFHHLSGGVPRVQSYAFENSGPHPADAMDALRPVGKKLDQVFRDLFRLALRKNGSEQTLALVCAGLTALPRPIPQDYLAAVLEMPTALVGDICGDLAPGLVLRGGNFSFADEDFETFVRQAGATEMQGVLGRCADRLLQHADQDGYAALNVAPALLAASRRQALLQLVERQPEPPPLLVSDPIRRREIHHQRLQCAIRVCRDAGAPATALRYVLIGADAMRTEDATIKLLIEHPRLTARHAHDTASRLLLGDHALVRHHGPLLFHLRADAAANEDALSVREYGRRIDAWLEARWDAYTAEVRENEHAKPWDISPAEFAASLYTALLTKGHQDATALFHRFHNRAFAYNAGFILVDRLLAEGKANIVESFLPGLRLPEAAVVLVALAISGRPIQRRALGHGLAALLRVSRLRRRLPHRFTYEDALGFRIIDTLVSGAELLRGLGGSKSEVKRILSPVHDAERRRIDQLHTFEPRLLDAILRAVCLLRTIDGRATSKDDILTPRIADASAKKNASQEQHQKENDRELSEFIAATLPLYTARARIICGKISLEDAPEELSSAASKVGTDRWRIERDMQWSPMRARAAESVAVLLGLGVSSEVVMRSAAATRGGWHDSYQAGPTTLFNRLATRPELHAPLLDEVARQAAETRHARVGSEERVTTLASQANLVASISPSDAGAIFKLAIEVTSELDTEIMSKLRVVSRLASAAPAEWSHSGSETARVLSDVVVDAAIRLEGYDHFPWNEVARALGTMHLPTALACATRWDDVNLVGADSTLPILICGGLDQDLAVKDAMLLCGLVPHLDDGLIEHLCRKAQQEAPSLADTIADELALDFLLDRLSGTESGAQTLSRYGNGRWVARLLATRDFPVARGTKKADDGQIRRESSGAPSTWLESYNWGAFLSTTPSGLVAEIETVAARSRKREGPYVTVSAFLTEARKRIPVSKRAAYLDALLIAGDKTDASEIVEELFKALQAWSTSPAIDVWCQTNLPSLITRHLSMLCRYLPWHDRNLRTAIELWHGKASDLLQVFLAAIEHDIDALGAESALGLVAVLAEQLPPSDCANLCRWYAELLQRAIPSHERESANVKGTPTTVTEALARTVYAYLGDVDVRLRWRAAHTLRRAGRLGNSATLAAILAQYQRTDESEFRDSTAPFYWLAARLWLLIGIDRLALESPASLQDHSKFITDVAFDDGFPHLLVRHFAKLACNKLVAAEYLHLTPSQQSRLDSVGESKLPAVTGERDYSQSFNHRRGCKTERRFRFDEMDTTRYWYDHWLSVFSDLTPEEFLDEAERWIVDHWGVQDEAPYGFREPRQNRFRNNWSLSNHGHGSRPTMEPYRTYLEWHAMWCAAGSLMTSKQLAAVREDDYGTMAYELRQNGLTHPPLWLADIVCPIPQLAACVPTRKADAKSADETVEDCEFLSIMMPSDETDYVAVDCYIEVRKGNVHQTSRISSALVSPGTAHALVRALQTTACSFDYYICPEGHDQEIRQGNYQLIGWLTQLERDTRLDDKDVFRNGISRIEVVPGKKVSRHLGLARSIDRRVTWSRIGASAPSFIYETWGEPETLNRSGYPSEVLRRAFGHRLLCRRDDLSEFLGLQKMDLIVEIEVNRREVRERWASSDQEDSTENEFERVLLLRRSGEIEAAECSLGAWRSPRS